MPRRRPLFICLMLVLAAGVLPCRAGEARRAPLAPDIQRILDRGTLVVAVAGTDMPPFVVTSADGSLAGDDVALAQGMARALGVAVSFNRQASGADDIIALLASGDADLALSRLSVTLDRAMRVRFSRPYRVLRQALLVNRQRFTQNARDHDPVEAASRPGAAIAVARGGLEQGSARRAFPEAHVAEYAGWQPDIVAAVLNGEVVAGFGDELEIKRALSQQPDAPLRLRMTVLPGPGEAIAVAVPWASTQLLAWVDLYLERTRTPAATESPASAQP
ncbi:MAG TPA: ABC transporter substrate-binding protein [Stellaceae bacterium]|nr:ABC transporter substrate-binding protein [Stellaceae bacterium]